MHQAWYCFKWIRFHEPYYPPHKDKPDGDDICMTNTLCNCSPTYTFDHHLWSNSVVPGDAPLFAFETGIWHLVAYETDLVPVMRCAGVIRARGRVGLASEFGRTWLQ